MSRNLCQTNCEFCTFPEMTLEEPARLITKEEARVYFDDYQGMLVANAHCPKCDAKYLAWVDETGRAPMPTAHGPYVWTRVAEREGREYFDLSFRSTFNDEPGEDDLPKWKVEPQWVRLGPWKEETR